MARHKSIERPPPGRSVQIGFGGRNYEGCKQQFGEHFRRTIAERRAFGAEHQCSYRHHRAVNGKEQFWEQICDTAHPNGRRMLALGGDVRERRYDARSTADNEPDLFCAVFNCLYSCCWMIASETEFNILLERIRSGRELPPDHELIVKRDLINDVSERVARKLGPMRPGPKKKAR